MTTNERESLTVQIVAAARRPMPEIVARYEILAIDGKWYGGGGMPWGVSVKEPVERRLAGYAFRDKHGVCYGTRQATEQALRDRHNQHQDANGATFRAALDGMTDAEVEAQADYWLKGKVAA